MNARVRLRSPSPSIRATASVVLSWNINRGTSPRKAKPPRWPSRMTGDDHPDHSQTQLSPPATAARCAPGSGRGPVCGAEGRKIPMSQCVGPDTLRQVAGRSTNITNIFPALRPPQKSSGTFLPGPGGVVLLSTVSNHSPKCSMRLAGRDRHHRHQDRHQEVPDPELKAPEFPENHSLPNRQGVWL